MRSVQHFSELWSSRFALWSCSFDFYSTPKNLVPWTKQSIKATVTRLTAACIAERPEQTKYFKTLPCTRQKVAQNTLNGKNHCAAQGLNTDVDSDCKGQRCISLRRNGNRHVTFSLTSLEMCLGPLMLYKETEEAISIEAKLQLSASVVLHTTRPAEPHGFI